MANPEVKTCAVGEYTKVATNVTVGTINLKIPAARDYQRFPELWAVWLDTGATAPTDDPRLATVASALVPDNQITISRAPCDIYLWPVAQTTLATVDAE